MSKASVSDGNGDKTVRSELSRGGYVTVDDKVAPPNYLVHLLRQNDVIMDIDVEEELNERGNSGDSDDDGDDARDFDGTMREVELERSRVLLGGDGIDQAGEGEMNSVLLHAGDTMDPDEIKFPKPPDDWVDPAPNTAKGGATFDKVYNPCGCSSFS